MESRLYPDVELRPPADGLSNGLLHSGGGCSVEQLSQVQHADPAPADEMDFRRHDPGDDAVHAVLRSAIPVGKLNYTGFAAGQNFRALACFSSTDVRLRQCAL